jgi:DNA-binding transcriptional MocR family regulator
VSVPEWRNALCKSGLKPTDRHVARAIAEYWKADGTCDDAYPSIRTLAGNTGLSETTVRRAIRSLEKAGFIVTSFRSRGGVENRYSAATPILAPTPGLDDANPGAGDGVTRSSTTSDPVIHDRQPWHPGQPRVVREKRESFTALQHPLLNTTSTKSKRRRSRTTADRSRSYSTA